MAIAESCPICGHMVFADFYRHVVSCPIDTVAPACQDMNEFIDFDVRTTEYADDACTFYRHLELVVPFPETSDFGYVGSKRCDIAHGGFVHTFKHLLDHMLVHVDQEGLTYIWKGSRFQLGSTLKGKE